LVDGLTLPQTFIQLRLESGSWGLSPLLEHIEFGCLAHPIHADVTPAFEGNHVSLPISQGFFELIEMDTELFEFVGVDLPRMSICSVSVNIFECHCQTLLIDFKDIFKAVPLSCDDMDQLKKKQRACFRVEQVIGS
jgi:hypothetical protein